MIFEDLIEHEIILNINDEEFYGYDKLIELPNNNKFVKNTLKIIYKKDKDGKDTNEIGGKIFKVREQETWNSFPLYEIIDGKIVSFDYKEYDYFTNTDRRVILAKKISQLYNIPSELKILRKTIKTIMDEIKLNYPNDFSIMDEKIEEVINKNPKDKSE